MTVRPLSSLLPIHPRPTLRPAEVIAPVESISRTPQRYEQRDAEFSRPPVERVVEGEWIVAARSFAANKTRVTHLYEDVAIGTRADRAAIDPARRAAVSTYLENRDHIICRPGLLFDITV